MAIDPLKQLKKIGIFSGLRPVALERIAAVVSQETHEKGSLLFSHGDSGDKLYLILTGKVRISRNVPGVGEENLAILGPGQTFGEMALLDEAERSADARVHETSEVLTLAKDAFDDLLFVDKELAYEVLWGMVQLLAGRLRETNNKLTLLSATGRF